jgi:hypothetical protein
MFAKTLALLALAASALSAHAGLREAFDAAAYRGRAIPFYAEVAADSPYADTMAKVRESGFAEMMAAFVGPTLRLKRDLKVGVAPCGRVNAFYSPADRSVTMCIELVEFITKRGVAAGLNKTAKGEKYIGGAMLGVYFHELAHAVIDINRVAFTGREEDVADQFSAYYALTYIEPGGYPAVIPAAWFYSTLASSRDLSRMDPAQLQEVLSNEHSLDQQRVYSVVCWAYGANRPSAEQAAASLKLSQERLSRCAGEYANVSAGVRRLFGPYLKTVR